MSLRKYKLGSLQDKIEEQEEEAIKEAKSKEKRKKLAGKTPVVEVSNKPNKKK